MSGDVGSGRARKRPADWTPVVLVTATLSLTIVGTVLLSSPRFRDVFETPAGPERARRALAPEVVVWVGELGPGLKGVLTPVWGERGPDLEHDATLNDALGVGKGRKLAFYRLLVFNTSETPQTVDLEDGAFSIEPVAPGTPVGLRSLAALVRRGEATVSPALAGVLKGQGSLEDAVEVPPGMMADLLVAFEQRVDLEQATGVSAPDGVSFARRRMARRDLEALLQFPDVERIRDL